MVRISCFLLHLFQQILLRPTPYALVPNTPQPARVNLRLSDFKGATNDTGVFSVNHDASGVPDPQSDGDSDDEAIVRETYLKAPATRNARNWLLLHF